MKLEPNSKVRFKSNPKDIGWLVALEGNNARVFIGDSVKIVHADEIEPVPRFATLGIDEFRVALTRRRIEHPLTDQLLSYKASKTHLYYNQFLPVKKILESPDQRLLIADEVGTGKTIEAGLVWAELEARAPHGLQNVWVVCPKALTGKWQEEMFQRFDLRLEPLTSESLRSALVSLDRDGILPPRFAQAVVNIELLRIDEYVERLGKTSIAWDYVIFDEAHHLRNTETLSNGLARFMCERAKAAVFLTATPLQTGLEDIVHLMEALGVDVAADPRLLEEQIRWDMDLNDHVNMFRKRVPGFRESLKATLEKLERSGGSARPGWGRLKELLSKSDPNDLSQRAEVLLAAHDVQVLDPYMTRTLRSEIDAQRCTREAITRVVSFNDAEEKFYRLVYGICLERAQALGIPPGFATQMPERRTASCAPAVAAEIVRRFSEYEEEYHRTSFGQEEIERLAPLARDVLESKDSKFDSLLEILKHLFNEVSVDRVMVFSTFRGTLHYLEENLRQQGYSLEVMHGGTPPKDEDCRYGEKSREQIAREFRAGDFQLLLASEVAGEGLDFEHCHVVINYDLPWNPMRVEQRIGRCDRLGQRSPKIHVASLASRGTIEERILSRLYERLHIFERALGDMELVLGEQIAAFEHDVFTAALTPKQQEEKLDRVAEAVANSQHQRKMIVESSDYFLGGRKLLEGDREEIKNEEARFLSPNEIGDFVYVTIQKKLPQSIRKLSREGDDVYEVLPNKNLIDSMRELQRTYPASLNARTGIARFLRRLEQGAVKISFDTDQTEVEYVHIRHPIVLLARWLDRDPVPDIPICFGLSAKVKTPTLLVWSVGSMEGYTNRIELISASADFESKKANVIRPEDAASIIAEIVPLSNNLAVSQPDIESLSAIAEEASLKAFEVLSVSVRARNNILIEKAQQAVHSQSQRKLQWLQRQLKRPDLKENISNLYRGWAARLESETQGKVDEIDQRGRFHTTFQLIGVAVLHPSQA